MIKGNKIKQFLLVVSVLAFSLSLQVHAKPWLDPGDMRLRHNLQVLSDAGYLKSPLTTWPLASEDIDDLLRQPIAREILKPAIKSALIYVNSIIKTKTNYSSLRVGGSLHSKALLVRDFSNDGREKYFGWVDGAWGSSHFDARLKFSAARQARIQRYLFSDHNRDEATSTADDAHAQIINTQSNIIHPNDSPVRLDESYLSGELGNWKITAGTQSRWWGPAWDGSFILSNNARPIPSISLQNIHSKAFESKLFNWIGPSNFHMFVGLLEKDRDVSQPKMFGFRYNFKPKIFKDFEVGLSRTLIWGGKGSNESLSGLTQSLFGINKNVFGDRLLGDNLAQIDMRWKLPLKNSKESYALYGQYLAEDTGNTIFGGNETLQLGASVSGYSKILKGSWRSYAEWVDTSSGIFSGADRNNTTYNHDFYLDGYRHLGTSMGYGIDSDSTMISLGGVLSKDNGDFWRAWVKITELDLLRSHDGINPIADPDGKKWSAVGVNLDSQFNKQIRYNLGTQLISEKPLKNKRKTSLGVSAGLEYQF